MRYGFCLLLNAIQRPIHPIVVNFYVFWFLVKSSLIFIILRTIKNLISMFVHQNENNVTSLVEFPCLERFKPITKFLCTLLKILLMHWILKGRIIPHLFIFISQILNCILGTHIQCKRIIGIKPLIHCPITFYVKLCNFKH